MAALIASPTRSITEAHGPTVHCAIGEPAVEGCGWVGAVFSAATGVPEPSAAILILAGGLVVSARRNRGRAGDSH